MSQQYIFTIEHLTKTYDEKAVLSDIWLAFFPGAKIGVIGNNGAGKSTLLRIMAGEDTDFMGEARPMKGIKVGYFPQEPRLDRLGVGLQCPLCDGVGFLPLVQALQRVRQVGQQAGTLSIHLQRMAKMPFRLGIPGLEHQ